MIDFARALKESHQQVDTVLECYFRDLGSQTQLIQAMRYSSLRGGKRLRPFLVYQTGQMFGLSPASLNAPAAAIECIHAYSLIHDDLPVMDNDELRRGLPTCHVKFGEITALLAGNALQTLAFSILANADMPNISSKIRLKMISILADATGANGMCFGQALDTESEGQKISAAHLETIYKYKTGSLIRAAVHMGVLATGKMEEPTLTYLDRYSTAIGLAFQVQDDILDVVGDNKITRKQKGIDKKWVKSTYPALLGLNIAQAKVQSLYYDALTSLELISSLGYDTAALIALAHYVIERDK